MDGMMPPGGGMMQAGGGMMGMGSPPLGNPANPQAMQALDQLSKSPADKGPKEAINEAVAKLQVALSRIYLQSPKAAKLISDALSKVTSAQSELEKEGMNPVAPPPNMMGGMNRMQGPGLPFGI